MPDALFFGAQNDVQVFHTLAGHFSILIELTSLGST
jgi:hypothetical protein